MGLIDLRRIEVRTVEKSLRHGSQQPGCESQKAYATEERVGDPQRDREEGAAHRDVT